MPILNHSDAIAKKRNVVYNQGNEHPLLTLLWP